jgi:BMFP domain-containing protein YqiC
MKNSEKLLQLISSFIENGIITTQDLKRELLTNAKFQKDSLTNKLNLVSREEFEVLKKIIKKQGEEIDKLSKKKKTKKAKKF